ncbi:hypothetical protein L0661_23760 [Dyadobacter sp. CY357]|uniref:Uncharacterized protein n=2 Tax=Dyadobacter chenhuakuii TaxID=2909339 RepID=A0A9X1TVJ3_9BACT|nr:hypothetical protein [Dyadobacter chenhuakuii]
MGYQDICWDDSDWLKKLELVAAVDLEDLVELLSNALVSTYIKAYHGCRVENAGVYHRYGILVNNPDDLAIQVKRLVNEEDRLASFRPRIEQMLLEFKNLSYDRERLYLALDDRILTDRDGHYLIYGSESILGILGEDAHEVLSKRGIPTLVHVQLPIRLVAAGDRMELAKTLIQEWTRIIVNLPSKVSKSEVPKKDLTFCLQENVSPNLIVAHSHPKRIHDPLHYGIWHKAAKIVCASCQSDL